jgi:hypothetical protein
LRIYGINTNSIGHSVIEKVGNWSGNEDNPMALSPASRNNSFRRGAIAATTAVAMLFAPNVFAQTAGGSKGCDALGPTNAGVQCVLRKLDHRIEAANARAKAADAKASEAEKRGALADRRGAAADKRGAAADNELACLDLIMKDLEGNGERTAKLTAVPPKDQACKTARELKLISG